jgi:hypothetical protein
LLDTHLESVKRREYDWVFDFGRGSSLTVGSLWRLLSKQRIQITSEDNDQQFGLKAPLNVATQLTAEIGKEPITDVQVDSATSDLTLRFANGLRLQIVNNSSGYEAWNFYAAGLQVVGQNGDTVELKLLQ